MSGIKQLHEDPEIWLIPIQLPKNPLRNLNVYVIRSAGESLIVDTGFCRPECREALRAGIRELGLDLDRTSVFLTHLHSDHIGLAPDFSRIGCPIYMNQIDYEYFLLMQSGRIWPYMEEWYCREGFPAEEISLQAFENQGRLYAPTEIFPIHPIRDGSLIKVGDTVLRCIETPGHTPGHTVLYSEAHSFLFPGDHILFDITPNISVWRDSPHSLEDYLSSLDKISRLDIKQTFPAHRSFTGDVHTRIRQIRQHHADRLSEISEIIEHTPGIRANEIAQNVSWSARGQHWDQFPPHQKWFAMGEVLAHLKYLMDHNGVLRSGGSSSVEYYPPK